MIERSVRIESVDAQGAAATQLLHEAALEARAVYPDLIAADAPLPRNPAWPARGVYLIAFIGYQPVGCGALRPIDSDAAEVRRMFVTRSARRQGLGRTLLVTLEDAAVALGFTILRLETGNRQSAAMALYEAHGFVRIAPFGAYTEDPTSVCFEKRLPAGVG